MEFLKTAIPSVILPGLVDLVSSAPNSLRKQLITIARYGDIAHGRGSFFHKTQQGYTELRDILSGIYDRDYRSSYSATVKTKGDFVEQELQKFLQNPLTRGYMIALCTILPLTQDEVVEEKMASFAKEINAMDRSGYNPELDFSPFFGSYDTPVAPEMRPNHDMALLVHSAIDRWRANMQRMVINITISRKLLPTFSRRELRMYTDSLLEDPDAATPGTIEWAQTFGPGEWSGPCEVSQRWYTNGISPRTYYIQGPTAYNRVRYTKELWNDLVDSLSVTNRRSRVNPNRIQIHGVKKALFYDLTNFTSNMRCQREFIKDLANYCAEDYVTIRDTSEGLIQVRLSDLITEYNEMNCFPEYKVTSGPYSGLEGTHGPAGFLGVYGNIATCNFLHGAFLLQFVQRDTECGCAGDDAVILLDPETNEDDFYGCISLIGILAVEKVYRSEDIDVVYLKRRTWMDLHRGTLRSSHYIQIPSLLPFIDWRNDTRFRERNLSRPELRILCGDSLKATFLSARYLRYDDVQDYTKAFLDRYYRALNFNPGGYLPQLDRTSTRKMPSYPAIETIFSCDYLEQTGELLYEDYVRLSVRDEEVEGRLIPKKGMSFRSSRSSIHLRLLERMGCVRKRGKVKREFHGEDGYVRLMDELRRRERGEKRLTTVYEYECLRDCSGLWANEGWDVNGEICESPDTEARVMS